MRSILSFAAALFLAAALLMVAAPRTQAATNELSSVQSRPGTLPGYYKYGYQGIVKTTDSNSIVRQVVLYVDGVGDGFATYLQQEQGNPLWWDYNGTGMADYIVGSQHDVKTTAQIMTFNGPVWVDSNTLQWTSGN